MRRARLIEPTEGELRPVMLVVGNLRLWQRTGLALPPLAGFHFAGFADVTAETLARIHPDVVISALFGPDFDALDLARRLSALAFGGRYRVLAEGLPNPAVVRQEIAGHVAGLDFDVFQLADLGL